MPEGLLLVVWSSIGLWVGLLCGSKVFALRWVGLGQSFGGLCWFGLKKLDPRTSMTATLPREIGLTLSDNETGNKSVPKMIVNDTINLFLKLCNQHLVVSNRNSFRVLFDEIASVYWKWPVQGTGTVPVVSAHFVSYFTCKNYASFSTGN